LILLGVFSLTLLTGCPPESPTLPPATPGGGFIIETGFNPYGAPVLVIPAPGSSIQGTWQSDSYGATGDPSSWTEMTNAEALASVVNGRAPATWTFTWVSSVTFPACSGKQSNGTVSLHGIEGIVCYERGGYVSGEAQPFVFSPNPLNPASLPSTVTIQGSGFISTYGMPVVQYFDMQGNLVTQQAVTSVSPDGTTLTATTPNISELAAGAYAGVINNINASGSYDYVGTVAVDVPLPMYRPTAYSDMGTNDPNAGWAATSSPDGPTTGGYLYGIYTASLNASDYFDYDHWNEINDLYSAQGQCTWSGFPSHVDANDLTLYIPYAASVSGSANGAVFSVTATIGGSTTTLYSSGLLLASTSGLITATIPAGTDLSSIQVTAYATPQNSNPGIPETLSESFALDIYVQ
jgi:hypothetical protein